MASHRITAVGDLLEMAQDKARWDYVGRWVQPTLSMCFWPLYTQRKAYRELGLPEAEADNIQLDGHYVELAPNKGLIEAVAVEAAKADDNSPFERHARVAEKYTKAHLEMSKAIRDGGMPPEKALPQFFQTMNGIIPSWIASLYFGYALERMVSQELKRTGLTHLELEAHFEMKNPTMMMRQEREAKEFAQYLRDANLLHLMDKPPKEAIGLLNRTHGSLAQRLSYHLEEFEWVGTHHCWGEPLTMERLFTQIKESKPAKPPAAKKNISEKLEWIIGWQNELAYWRQYCAETSDVGFYLARNALARAGKEFGYSYQDIIWLSDREILATLESGKAPSKSELKEREKGFGYAETEEEEIIFTGKPLRRLVEIHVPKTDAAVRQFAGTVGSKGFAVGTAFVCFTPQETAAMKKGEILVVPQTTPDYVVVMKKAAAIVTDEGGITCHAAVVSRELGVPCVVGTKIATHVIKTGDKIEVDANTGTITRL